MKMRGVLVTVLGAWAGFALYFLDPISAYVCWVGVCGAGLVMIWLDLS